MVRSSASSKNVYGSRDCRDSIMTLAREPEEYTNICAQIGHLSLKWAMAESALDMIVFLAHALYGGKEIAELPRSFRLKPPYLRTVFTRNTLKAHHLIELEPLLAESSEISNQRNTIIHGILTIHPNGKIVQHVYRADRRKPHIQTVSLNKMDELATRCSFLTFGFMKFTASLGIIIPDKLDDFHGAFPVQD